MFNHNYGAYFFGGGGVGGEGGEEKVWVKVRQPPKLEIVNNV